MCFRLLAQSCVSLQDEGVCPPPVCVLPVLEVRSRSRFQIVSFHSTVTHNLSLIHFFLQFLTEFVENEVLLSGNVAKKQIWPEFS